MYNKHLKQIPTDEHVNAFFCWLEHRLHLLYIAIILSESRQLYAVETWDGIFKLLRSPEINSKESIPPAFVTFVALFFLYFLFCVGQNFRIACYCEKK